MNLYFFHIFDFLSGSIYFQLILLYLLTIWAQNQLELKGIAFDKIQFKLQFLKIKFRQYIKMGNQLSSFAYSSNLNIPDNCKLYSVLPIIAPSEQQQMTQILQKRIKLSHCPYICTIKGYDFLTEQSNKLQCSQDKKLIVYYDYFDYRLIDVSIKNYAKEFNQGQLCFMIKCITQALLYLRKYKLHHGDVSLQNICRKGKGWKLIDKIFIKNGINAYEKVLEGETGFISPKHMMRIRHGFIKQSPQITEADDIFSLGMVILQLASGVPSTLCYKQLNVRFNQDVIKNNTQICHKKYSQNFIRIIEEMINFQEEDRISIDRILANPLVQGRQVFSHLNNVNSVPNRVPDVRQNIHMNKNSNDSHLSYNKNNFMTVMRSPPPQSRKPYTPGSTAVKFMDKPQNDNQMTINTPRGTVGSFKSSQYSVPIKSKQDQTMTRIINPTITFKNPQYQRVVGPSTNGQESSMGGHRLKTIN